jgi:putative oxidoreductase
MLNNLALLVARIFIAGLFIWDGTVILRNIEGTIDYMQSFGVPSLLLPLVVGFQILGGVLIVLGWFTRIVAVLFAGFAVMTALFFHRDLGVHNEALQFAKDIAISGGFLALFAAGPGAWSIDARRSEA